jgi:hypothetical protein
MREKALVCRTNLAEGEGWCLSQRTLPEPGIDCTNDDMMTPNFKEHMKVRE